MNTALIGLIKQSLKNGGKEVVVRPGTNKRLWEVLVMDRNYVYLSYIVGKENATFFFDLFEFLRENRTPVKISYQ